MKLLKWFREPQTTFPVSGKADGLSQLLLIEPAVLEHVNKFRQLNTFNTEAGGQLFGYVNENKIIITAASGPYKLDQRGRFNYRSDPSSAQKVIEGFAKIGIIYLGEWHTHAEDFPSASSSDTLAMSKLLNHSTLNLNGLLMLIVGRSYLISGYSITLFRVDAKFGFELSSNEKI